MAHPMITMTRVHQLEDAVKAQSKMEDHLSHHHREFFQILIDF